MINLRFACPQCQTDRVIDDVTACRQPVCECGWSDELPTDAIIDGKISRCVLCGTDEFYVQKDFPERIGIALVVAAVVLATIAWARYSWWGTIGTLVAFFAVDWVLFHTRKDVTVCYRCLAQYRGLADNPAHKAFDLAVGEKYRQERLRKKEMKV